MKEQHGKEGYGSGRVTGFCFIWEGRVIQVNEKGRTTKFFRKK